MKFKPIAFFKSLKPISFLKSLNWNKEDYKKITMFVIMLLIVCFILNNFLLIKVRITQGRRSIPIDGSVSIDGSVDADVSGSISTY